MKKISAFLLTLVLVISVLFCGMPALAEDLSGPEISIQPQDVYLTAPNKAEFKIVPKNADEVASYRWYYVDPAGKHFKLEGLSAVTDTLICPTISSYQHGTYYYCVLTGKNGKTTVSNPAYVYVLNPYDEPRVLYVGNYAVKLGETLDLSKTELGTGKITYSDNGESITLDNVHFDNSNMITDYVISDAIGLMLYDYKTEISKLTVNLIGENVIKNVFYQEETNGSGITFDLYFIGKESGQEPPVEIKGNGNLTLIGGTIQLRTNGNLTLSAPVNFRQYNGYFCDAVNGKNVVVSENVPLTFDVNGTLIYAKAGIVIKSGAKIDGKTSAPYVMNDYTFKNGFLSTYGVKMDNAEVNIKLTADADRFVPNGTAIAGLLGINTGGDITLNNSTLTISEEADESNVPYFWSGGGISCDTLTLNNSKVQINVNSKDINDSNGIMADTDVTVTDSTLICNVHTSGRVFGIAASGKLTVHNSTVTADCVSYDDEAFGIMYKTAEIDLKTKSQKVSASINNGYAMGANIGKGAEKLKFDESYVQKATVLGENTAFVTPKDAVLNQASMSTSGGDRYIYIETPYSKAQKDAAAKEVVISGTLPDPEPEEESPKTSQSGTPLAWLLALCISEVGIITLLLKRIKG